MATSDRGGDLDTAYRALEASRLCVTSVRTRLRTPDRDIEYEGSGASFSLSDRGPK